MSSSPSTNGSNGRDSSGRFTRGNSGGPGNPRAREAARLREVLLTLTTPAHVRKITKKLIEMAIAGDLAAIRELLDRTIGKACPTELLERLEKIEAALRLNENSGDGRPVSED